jgi:hypothetical protein
MSAVPPFRQTATTSASTATTIATMRRVSQALFWTPA